MNVSRSAFISACLSLSLAVAWCGSLARADDLTVEVILENDAFVPAEVNVPAATPFILKVINRDGAAAEIESKELKIEKVVAGDSEIIVRVKAQEAGRYLFVNEYKEDTVKGFVVVE